jgi:hypothetical protein
MQLTRAAVGLALAASLAPARAAADDAVDVTTTWFQEPREGGKGLTVIHPQLGLAFDLGERVEVSLGYQADIVSGATPAVYSVDAVSSATPFSDTRHAGDVAVGLEGRMAKLSLSGGLAAERDYASVSIGAAGTVYLPGKNTELTLSYTRNFDQVCDKENAGANGALEKRPLTIEPCEKEAFASLRLVRGVDSPRVADMAVDTVWRNLDIDTLQASVTQVLTPTALMQLGVYGAVLDGYQANPYRRVRIGPVEAQETVPEVRGRLAVFGRVKKYLPGPRAAVGFGVRGYADTWGVEAGSAEMSYTQYVGSALLFELRSRVYQQSQATFFKDAFFYETESTAGAYFTGDRELAPLRNVLAGAKLAYARAGSDGEPVWRVFDEVVFHLKAELLFYDELDAESAGPNLAGTGDQFATSDGIVDALLVQLGLRMRY